MSFSLSDTQQVTCSIQITDKKGNPARIDGAPAWLVDNPNVLALTPTGDGLSCLIAAVGPLGTARVSVTADADLGTGVSTIAGMLDVEVVSGAAVNVVINPGTPSEQPPAPAPTPPAPTPPAPATTPESTPPAAPGRTLFAGRTEDEEDGDDSDDECDDGRR